jgi:hypothetical protein
MIFDYSIPEESTLDPLVFTLQSSGCIIVNSMLHRLELCFRERDYPDYIMKIAKELTDNNETDVTVFYPLYLAILLYWFPAGFSIAPQWVIPGTDTSVDFAVNF